MRFQVHEQKEHTLNVNNRVHTHCCMKSKLRCMYEKSDKNLRFGHFRQPTEKPITTTAKQTNTPTQRNLPFSELIMH